MLLQGRQARVSAAGTVSGIFQAILKKLQYKALISYLSVGHAIVIYVLVYTENETMVSKTMRRENSVAGLGRVSILRARVRLRLQLLGSGFFGLKQICFRPG